MPQIPDALQNEISNLIRLKVDAGAGAGKYRFWNNSGKSSLLAEVPCDATNAFSASGVEGSEGAGSQAAEVGKSWLNDPTNRTASPVLTGVCGWAELTDSDNNIVEDGNPGLTGSGEFVELATLSLDTGVPITGLNGYIKMPKGSA